MAAPTTPAHSSDPASQGSLFNWGSGPRALLDAALTDDALAHFLGDFSARVDQRGNARKVPAVVSFDREGRDSIPGDLYCYQDRLIFVSADKILREGDTVCVHLADRRRSLVVKVARDGQRHADRSVRVFYF